MKPSLVTRIALRNFRGLAEASLEGLAPLTVLTGRNGCGKSTLLDGLLIGVSQDPGAGLAQVVARRKNTPDAGRWLFGRGDFGRGDSAVLAGIESLIVDESGEARLQRTLSAEGGPAARRLVIQDQDRKMSAVVLDADEIHTSSNRHLGMVTRLIDSSQPGGDLAIALSNLRGQVFRGEVDAMIGLLLPGAVRLDISIPGPGAYTVEVTFKDYAVPLGVAGDGIQAAVQLAIELAQVPEGGLALIEEPEVFLHPRALRQIAQVLLRTMNRGVQVVLTTHSLDLIDSLVQESTDEDEAKMALFRLRLEEGKLLRSRYSGSDMAFARTEVAEDLR